jgi:hypothetical protein
MQVDTQDRFYKEILDMSTKNSSAYNTLFSKERIETLIGGVKQAKDATKPSGKERTLTEVEYYFDVPHRVTEILI